VAGSMAADSMAADSMAGALRDEVLQVDLGVPASREAAPWLLLVRAFAASVWSGDLPGAVLHGAVAGPADAGLGDRAGGDGVGRLRQALPPVSLWLLLGATMGMEATVPTGTATAG
jgi:hypothetical protein